MAWYYVLDGASRGPVADAEIRQLRAQNIVAGDTPVWTNGMAEWLPFERSALAGFGSAIVTPVVTHTCAECGKAFPEEEMIQYDGAWVCAACKPIFFQRIKEGVAPAGTLAFASVGIRFLAILIDSVVILFAIGILVLVPYLLVATWVVSPGKTVGQEGWVIAVLMLLVYGFPPFYEIIFIGKYGATPGKMLMKIRVIRPDGSGISYARSTGRYFAKILSGMIFYIGFLMAFWDEEKRDLHDRLCLTRVIRVDGP